jgi:mRNA-degrading endonuclease RelE of RelBE toxin-antitoxin system
METYEIRSSRSIAKDWRKLEESFPDVMEKCKKFLQESPLDRSKSGGKLKKLKGKQQGFLQYDIDDSNRVWYEVDKKEHIVAVKYVGCHPK